MADKIRVVITNNQKTVKVPTGIRMLVRRCCNAVLQLGDVVISVEKARDQAELYGHSFQREIGYLTAHSVLHLLGYDHIEKLEKVRMREKEELVMEQLGLPASSSYIVDKV